MKKFTRFSAAVCPCVAIALMLMLSVDADAQNVGGYLAGKAAAAAKKAVTNRVDKTVDNVMDSAANTALDRMGWGKGKGEAAANDTTPKSTAEILRGAPEYPSPAKIAEYTYYKGLDNPPMLKLATNPVTAFLVRNTSASINAMAGITSVTEERAEELQGAYAKKFEETYGISIEQANAMSDEELQQYLLTHSPKVSNTSIALDDQLSKLLEQYQAAEDDIQALFDGAQKESENIWNTRYAGKGKTALLQFYQEVAPLYVKAGQQVRMIRIERQLPTAQKFNAHAKELAEKDPENTVDVVNYESLLLMSFFNDAVVVIDLWTPEFNN